MSDYIPIFISTLEPNTIPGVDLFQREADGDRFVLYCADDHPIDEGGLARLRARGTKHLYVASGSRDLFQQYLRSLIEAPSRPGEVSVAARAGALSEVVRDVLDASFSAGDLGNTVAEASRWGALTAGIICSNSSAAAELFRVLHHDYATFTHSANVAFYAAMLAAKLGFSQHDIEQITTGGLLHDLGKLSIDDKILSKPGRLTEGEFRTVKMHPTWGLRQLGCRKDLSFGQLMMVYQHHERVDGEGYPVGILDDEIHDWAKICAVVDVFEAMTSFRPYRGPMPKQLALEIMEKDRSKAFDSEVLECWAKLTREICKF
ncbi:Cyclic di-GMP phosphodiesterase response regulator RpfG [Rubripirellula lacrimiformis]|uniref:Cyclic di-GMP phosphodiesterase response regulator RpfG n=1 Tax=Rubripirellula lacrimiformis TaxID=1930273 RepID=A0A517NIH1_9BACT|nr:HD domain-containing phosphohydrolase [Rubripirellula lacrimiformis]QDT06931.1 Cyclic di-GMP phosphodiesterase response regulator RpfG [Rubripirellula lacrimiformis]